MKIDKAGMDFMHNNEACRLTAYLDTGMVPTIGWGSIRIFGNPVKLGMKITQEQADEQYAKDLAWAEKCVNSVVKVPLTQNQYNALVDFTYNIGEDQFKKSTLLKLLNQKKYDEAAKQFMRWVYDNGREVEGLKNRRRRTKALFES